MKKHLSLLLAILMLLTSVGFNAYAASDCQHETSMSDSKYYKVVYPDCENQGYTLYYCIKCGDVVRKDSYTNSLGHQWSDEKYEPNGKGDYRMYKTCTREYIDNNTGKAVTCGAKAIDREGENEVVYHLVEFWNHKATKSYDPEIKYTKVVLDYKPEYHIAETYVKDGEDAYYQGDDLVRGKTKAFAEYKQVGWADYDFEATADEKFPTEIPEGKHYYQNHTITKVTSNMKLYPVFEGRTKRSNGSEIQHIVTFYILDDNNQIEQGTVEQEVNHGGTAAFRNPDGEFYPVTKKEDTANTYEFKGWVTGYGEETSIPMEKIEETPIYGNVSFFPEFNAIAKNYIVEFYKESKDSEGKIVYNDLFKYDNNTRTSVFKNVHLGTNILSEYENSEELQSFLNRDDNFFAKQGDKEYIYLWTGKWALLLPNGTVGRVVDLKNFNVFESEYRTETDADGNLVTYEGSDEIKKVIRLVPVYEKKRQIYSVDITMLIPESEDTDYYRKDADVHVTANNGQLVASGKTDANGTFRCNVYYQVPFTVTVATQDGKYLGNYTIYDLVKYDGDANKEAELNKCYVAMQLNPEYETHCRCIHHNAILQPIFVRILNILYSIFNFKYVCCYDMYSTIGPLLDYTA